MLGRDGLLPDLELQLVRESGVEGHGEKNHRRVGLRSACDRYSSALAVEMEVLAVKHTLVFDGMGPQMAGGPRTTSWESETEYASRGSASYPSRDTSVKRCECEMIRV